MQTPSRYTSTGSVRAVWKGVLSQDVITTTTIPVDSLSPSPVAVFTNPASGGVRGNAAAEALAIVNTGRGRQLCHVARDADADAGWRATPLFGGQAAEQVAAGVAYAGTSEAAVCGFFALDNQLYFTSLGADGALWAQPKAAGSSAARRLRVAYSPQGRLVVYGATAAGNLMTAYQPQVGGAFVTSECAVDGALSGGDFQLCLTDEQSWTIAAIANGKPVLITGVLGAAQRASAGPAPGLNEEMKHVALGYWNSAQNTLMFLLVDKDSSLRAWSQSQTTNQARVQPIPNSSVAHATGHVGEDGSLHVYAVDADERLWVLHQSPSRPWSDDGSPNWAPLLALDRGVARVVSDMNPTAEPSLFALAAGDFSLRLHARDETSRLWQSHEILQSSAKAFEVARFRTEISIIDGNGVALPKHSVRVATEGGASSVDVWAAGAVHRVDEKGLTLQTDALGKLTLAVMASEGLSCPRLVIGSESMSSPITVDPAGETHRYLAGEGTLHPTNPGGALPVFDASGRTLAAATVGGKPLAPGASDATMAAAAAQAIRGAASIGSGRPTVHAFAGSLQKHAPAFHAFHSAEQLHAHRMKAGLTAPELGAIDWGALAGDIFEGIRNGVIAISEFVVDVANKTVDLVLKIAKWTEKVARLAFDGIEKIASFIAGVFHAVEAAVEKVVDWLKALFDFGAIWRTKMAIEEGLLGVPEYVRQLALSNQKRADRWFAEKKVEVDKAFAELKARYDGKKFEDSPNWQKPGAPSPSPLAGNASPADFTSNTHHNWLQDKVASYAPDKLDVTDESQNEPWTAFAEHLHAAGDEFTGALEKFKDAFLSVIQNPSSFSTVAVPCLIDAAGLLVKALLDACDAAVDALAGLAVTAMDALKALLEAELPIPFLRTLFQWLAEQAGYPHDGKLTAAALISLAAAFPATLIYKLMHGVNAEPFPNGRFPRLQQGMLGVTMPKVCREIACIVGMVSVIPSAAGDILGEAKPTWMTILGLGFTAAVWVLENGYPELTALQWASVSAVAANLLWIAPAAYFVLETENAVLLDKIKAVKSDALSVGFSLYGAFSLTMGILVDTTTKVPLGQGIANILQPLPSLFSFLGLRAMRNNPAVAPYAIAAKVLVDFVGTVGGGAEKLVSVMKSPAAA
ncbi:MAG TPA: hypothetical protein VEK11_12695 [Thermoanaerobaculia bacterium]|nr:hypothetical protein [Thermoanaerobaculia bacterium]